MTALIPTTTVTDEDQAMTLPLPFLAGIGVVVIIAVAAISRRRIHPTPVVSPDARVLIVCPYCGAKNEQGILKCQSCGARL